VFKFIHIALSRGGDLDQASMVHILGLCKIGYYLLYLHLSSSLAAFTSQHSHKITNYSN